MSAPVCALTLPQARPDDAALGPLRRVAPSARASRMLRREPVVLDVDLRLEIAAGTARRPRAVRRRSRTSRMPMIRRLSPGGAACGGSGGGGGGRARRRILGGAAASSAGPSCRAGERERRPPARAATRRRRRRGGSRFVDLGDELLHQPIDHEVAVGDLVLAVPPARLHLGVALLGYRRSPSCTSPTFLMMSFWLRTKYEIIDGARGERQHEAERTAERVAQADPEREQEARADRDLLGARAVDDRVLRERERRLPRRRSGAR